MAPFVLILMWLLSPVAWPTAKLLDYVLGEDHGTTYKKAGLKTLVTLHRTLGTAAEERLNKDEVTIISAVLDLKEKTIGRIMTPMQDVFTLSADTVLDEGMTNRILAEGYSRIPIHTVESKTDFIGMLLVKMLITYDPEDCLKVRDFPLATLPETRPETSCLDIINFFQEGKSHMILVSEYPGESAGALGVVTLEDVIEELIGEEIIDESDVFIDVHRAIRRLHPAPRFKVPKGEIVGQRTTTEPAATAAQDIVGMVDSAKESTKSRQEASLVGRNGVMQSPPGSRKASVPEIEPRSPTAATYLMRRRSSSSTEPTAVRSTAPELRQHLKHLGPSNAASRPKPTTIKSVKIKPGINQMFTLPETKQLPADGRRGPPRAQSMTEPTAETTDELTSLLSRVSDSAATGESKGQPLLSAGLEASDAVHAVNYGTLSPPPAETNELLRQSRSASGFHSPDKALSSPSRNARSPPSAPTSPKSTPSVQDPLAPADIDGPPGSESTHPSLGDQSQDVGNEDGNQQQAVLPSTQNQLAGPPAPVTRLKMQHTTRDPSMHVHIKPASKSNPSYEDHKGSSEGRTFEVPKKLVIELERQNSHVSELSENESGDTLGSLHSFTPSSDSQNGNVAKQPVQARSGSITEQIIDVGGLKKVVLEAQPSSSDDEQEQQESQEGSKSGDLHTKGSSEGWKGKEKAHANGNDTSVADDGDDAGTVASLTNEDAQKKKKKNKQKRMKKRANAKKKEEDAATTGVDAS